MLTGQEIALVIFFLRQILITILNFVTAALAIINLALFLIPTKAPYFETTSAVLGKLYSNTMMVVLNSRMVHTIAESTLSDRLQVSPIVTPQRFFASQGGVSVTHEQWSDPLEHPLDDFKMVSVTILQNLDIDIESFVFLENRQLGID